jgi:hypothetical protein
MPTLSAFRAAGTARWAGWRRRATKGSYRPPSIHPSPFDSLGGWYYVDLLAEGSIALKRIIPTESTVSIVEAVPA